MSELNKQLLLASSQGDLNEVMELISKGAMIHAQDQYQSTSLHAAAKSGHLEVVKYLLTVDPTVQLLNQNNNTPLHSAAYGNHPLIVQELINHGALMHAVNKDGDTPLHSAAWKGNASTITVLADNFVDLEKKNNDGDTALHLAAWNNHLKAISALSFKKAHLNSKNNDGDTPLHLAYRKGHIEAITLLIDLGANPNQLNNQSVVFYKQSDCVVLSTFQLLTYRIDKLIDYGLYLFNKNIEQGKAALYLGLELKKSLRQFTEKSPIDQRHELNNFKQAFMEKLHSKNKEMAIHRNEWQIIIANIAIALTGIGFITLGIHYALTKQCFFAQTKRQELIQQIAQTKWVLS